MKEADEKKKGRFGKWLLLLLCSLTVSFVFRAELADLAVKVAAGVLNRKAPTMVGDGLRLDGVSAAPEMRLLARLTLLDVPGTGPVARQIRTELPTSVRESTCSEEKVRRLIDFGLTLEMTFSGNDGNEIFTTVVDAAACSGTAAGPATAAMR